MHLCCLTKYFYSVRINMPTGFVFCSKNIKGLCRRVHMPTDFVFKAYSVLVERARIPTGFGVKPRAFQKGIYANCFCFKIIFRAIYKSTYDIQFCFLKQTRGYLEESISQLVLFLKNIQNYLEGPISQLVLFLHHIKGQFDGFIWQLFRIAIHQLVLFLNHISGKYPEARRVQMTTAFVLKLYSGLFRTVHEHLVLF